MLAVNVSYHQNALQIFTMQALLPGTKLGSAACEATALSDLDMRLSPQRLADTSVCPIVYSAAFWEHREFCNQRFNILMFFPSHRICTSWFSQTLILIKIEL